MPWVRQMPIWRGVRCHTRGVCVGWEIGQKEDSPPAISQRRATDRDRRLLEYSRAAVAIERRQGILDGESRANGHI